MFLTVLKRVWTSQNVSIFMLTTKTLRMLGSGQLLGSEGGSWVALGCFWAALGWLLGDLAGDFWAALG